VPHTALPIYPWSSYLITPPRTDHSKENASLTFRNKRIRKECGQMQDVKESAETHLDKMIRTQTSKRLKLKVGSETKLITDVPHTALPIYPWSSYLITPNTKNKY